MRIVTLLLFLAVLGLAGSALAGPNAGGTLIVHDPSMTYTSEGAPFPGPAPTLDPPTVDNELPVGVPPDGPGWVWKVYAAFPIGSSPRLKAFVMGAQFGGDVVVLDGGLPGPLDFELPQDGWPTTTGGGVGISFYPLRTDPVVECYWFGGYGELGGIWSLAPHPTQQMIFVDDTSPPQEDPIAGLSTIGFGVAGETAYPGPLPVFGACCYPDGHCEFLEQSECATGDWRQDVPCDPNPCPQPPEGACCYPDGTCVTTIAAECPTGEWYEGVPCDPNPCPQPPVGACCFPEGECALMTENDCLTGVWLPGETACDPNPCPQPPAYGACCFPDGHCVYIQQAYCASGDWREGECEPNPCPQPPVYGACCYPDGDCEYVEQADCSTGDWREGEACDPNPCPFLGPVNAGGVLVVHDTGIECTEGGGGPYPSDPPPTCDDVDNVAPPDTPVVWKVYAAFPDENHPRLKALSFGATFDPAVVTVEEGGLPSPMDFEIPYGGWPTSSSGGVGISFWETKTAHIAEVYWFCGYGGLGAQWNTAPHPVQLTEFADDQFPPQTDPIAGLGTIGFGTAGETPCGQQEPTGACCRQDGSCWLLLEWSCQTLGGIFYGGPCVPNPCPQPPVGACCFPQGQCELMTEDDCPTGVWLPGETTCVPNPCPQPPVGACCYPDGQCFQSQEHQCPTGVWLLAPCDPNPCPQPPVGACCHPDGTCTFIPEEACPTGDWREGVPCDPNPCPQPPEGACCLADGTCYFIPEEACPTSDWREGVPCDPNPCPVLPQGACCYPDGQCVYTYAADCPTGDWRDGVPCDPNPCPALAQGACCYPDGHCVYTYEANCSTGDWREGVACQPNPCPAPGLPGACCYGYTCYVRTQNECTGEWQGAGTDCEPNPCCRRAVPPPSGPKDPIAKSAVGPGRGVLAPAQRDNPCPGSELYLNFDGSAEDGYAWQYGGVVPPDFGSLAEGFPGVSGYVCGVQLLLTQIGNATGQPIDVYVWDMDGECGIPGAVLSVTTPVVVSGVAFWPSFSAHDIDTADAQSYGDGFYAGYWSGGWQGGPAGFYCVADRDGFGGLPRTNIAPGIGYPTGWQDPSIVWGTTQALGIGAYAYGGAVPTVPTSWGKIKAMYR